MRLIDALKEKGKPFVIPVCPRNELPELFKELGFKVGAEIGVYKGNFTRILGSGGLRIYGIDPWSAFGRGGTRQARDDYLYEKARRTIKDSPNCSFIRKTSMDALADFRDGSLDFVYIDANHEFRYVAEDIYEWSKKVRVDGVVSGHDYVCTDDEQRNKCEHVGPVVDAYAKAFGIENYYVFGRSKQMEEEGWHDRYLSWFWIK